ncbi:DUF1330 domain-containing protein [Candidatus Kapabacteria bacterium]|nr:DUF1330 domain-containing protein [Candidatus Kapabacteria bacterium]
MKNLVIIFFLATTVMFSNQTLAQETITPRPILVINAVVDKEHKSELGEYLSQMMQIFKDHGGKPLGRYKTIEKLKGSHNPEMIAMVSFGDVNTIKNMLDSDKYKSLSDLRERVFSELDIIVCKELN